MDPCANGQGPMIQNMKVERRYFSWDARQASVSVILCTHNPRSDYLSRVLASLRGQTLPVERWDFLLIDNASSRPLAETWDISWHRSGRHIREDELGLTAARLRGIKESSGELLIFVDDDNELAPDFLDQAIAIAARSDNLGVFGAGILEPEFEVQPSVELHPYLGLLALRSVSSALRSGNPKDSQCVPWGAGLCVTRRVANFYQQMVGGLGINAVLDRRGTRLFCGGDDLFSRIAAEIGLEFGILPELRITHLISASRLNQRHLLRLIRDHALSHGVLGYLLNGIQPGQKKTLAHYASLLLHGIKNGIFSMRCQWAEARGEADAAQFVSARSLKPLEAGHNAYSPSQTGKIPGWLQFAPIIPLIQTLVETGLQ
jgi:glycosyltransferase involved in cell wall biosynthesis